MAKKEKVIDGNKDISFEEYLHKSSKKKKSKSTKAKKNRTKKE